MNGMAGKNERCEIGKRSEKKSLLGLTKKKEFYPEITGSR